jgi:hypothetical protein
MLGFELSMLIPVIILIGNAGLTSFQAAPPSELTITRRCSDAV